MASPSSDVRTPGRRACLFGAECNTLHFMSKNCDVSASCCSSLHSARVSLAYGRLCCRAGNDRWGGDDLEGENEARPDSFRYLVSRKRAC
jgi:hypothetical protein